MKLEQLRKFVNQIEDEFHNEERSVAELEILFGVLTEELNTPRSDKDLDTHLTLLDLRDRIIVMLEAEMSSPKLAEFFKKNLRRIAIQNLSV